MVLFHVALGAALNCTPDQITRTAPPALEELMKSFSINTRTLTN